MATQWILGKVTDALAPTVHNACASAGTVAGGAFNTIGSSINGVGESINTNIRYYGDGAKDYGNAIMDWSGATGSRAQTAGNPLGLGGSTGGGKAKATNPTIYKAPVAPKREVPKAATKKETPKVAAAPAQKKIAAPPKPVVAAANSKPVPKVSNPVKMPSTHKPTSTPAKAAVVSKPVASKGGVSIGKVNSPVKPGTAAPTAQGKPVAKNNTATNPLGLNF